MIGNFLSVAMKVLILFLLMSVGFVLGRKKIITETGTDQMNFLLLNVVVPCVIIDAFQVDKSQIPTWNLWFTVIAGLVYVLAAVVIVKFCFNKEPDGRRQVLKFGAMFSNCGFMGFPMVQEVLGDRGMVYAAIINTIVTVAMWTVGFVVMGKEGEWISIRKVALNPGAVGVYIGLPLLLFSLELPDPFQSVVGFLADMNTPLAMICIGVFISKTKLLDIFKEKTLYWVTVIRLLLIPAAVMGILLLFQPDYIPMTSSNIQFCAPSAGLTAIFAARFRHDTTLAAKTVAISTLLSILTMPLFCVALQTIYGV